MAGACTISENRIGQVKKIKWSWTSDASGNVTAVGQTANVYNGKLELLTTVPDGVQAPTDNYDITIVDEDGVDVLAGAGQNRDTATTEQVLGSSLGAVASQKLTLAVANAGNAKSGVCYLYIR